MTIQFRVPIYAKIMADTLSSFGQRALVSLGLLGVSGFVLVVQWDTLIHQQRGHQRLEPAHLVILGTFVLYAVCGALSLAMQRSQRISVRERNGLKLVLLGGGFILPAVVIDELWHKIFGKDMTAWSFPHIIMFFCMATVLFGIAVFAIQSGGKERRGLLSSSNFPVLVLFTGIFFLVPFFFMDFDLPAFARLAETRPGFTYSVTATGVIVFLLLLMVNISRGPGTVMAAAFLAWALVVATGLAFGTMDMTATAPRGVVYAPFPTVVLVIPVWFFLLVVKKRFPLSLPTLFAMGLLGTTAGFWGIVAWVKAYTKLPQAVSGGPADWFAWYVLSLAVLFVITPIVYFLSRWLLEGAGSEKMVKAARTTQESQEP